MHTQNRLRSPYTLSTRPTVGQYLVLRWLAGTAAAPSAQLELNYDVNDATAQILTRINQVRNQLPEGSEDPVLTTNRGVA